MEDKIQFNSTCNICQENKKYYVSDLKEKYQNYLKLYINLANKKKLTDEQKEYLEYFYECKSDILEELYRLGELHEEDL